MKLKTPAIFATAIVGVSTLIYAAPDLAGPPPKAASTSMAEMLIRVKQGRDKIALDARHVLHLQQNARKAKDVIRLNCVNDKFIQIKAEMNLSDRANQTFEQSGDDVKQAAFEDFNTHVEAVRRLREQADLCAGEPTLASESKNDWAGPDVRDNPFKDPFAPPLEPPAYASPIN